MKIVIAPDSFKGNMRAVEACSIIEDGLRRYLPDAVYIKLPLADGGEGTAQTLIDATGGKILSCTVEDPLGRPITASYGILSDGKTAVMDMASASGLELLSEQELNPLLASTRGTGQMIVDAVKQGVDTVIMGIGGSATVDGGVGMAQTLGFSIHDNTGKDIRRGAVDLDKISVINDADMDTEVRQALHRVQFKIACDVTNPLLGEKGAAAVFAPQKGADAKMMIHLENSLQNLSEVWIKNGMLTTVMQPGDGAAGGLGAGLRAFLDAEILPGAQLVMEYTGFFDAVSNADLVITGEGRTDSQTKGGKLCSAVAAECHKRHVPVVLVSGALVGDLPAFHEDFFAAFSISSGQATLERQIRESKSDLYFTAMNIARFLQLSGKNHPA